MKDPEAVAKLQETARELRKHALWMIAEAGFGAPGACLSCAEILTVLLFHEMSVDPGRPTWVERDRLVLSKAHAAPILYAALKRRGYLADVDLTTFARPGSPLQGLPDRTLLPCLDATLPTSGHGLSVAVGLALAARLDARDVEVFAVLSDGELQEGQTWEAAMTAAHHRLGHLCAVIDLNGQQADGTTAETKRIEALHERFRAFGWTVFFVNGHSIQDLVRALTLARRETERPSVVIAKTVRGRGVPSLERVAVDDLRLLDQAAARAAIASMPLVDL